MKIEDAKPGDVLRDPEGSVWVRLNAGTACIHQASDLDEPLVLPAIEVLTFGDPPERSPERFGPFVRLVPDPPCAPDRHAFLRELLEALGVAVPPACPWCQTTMPHEDGCPEAPEHPHAP